MNVSKRITTNMIDVLNFGPQFLYRHFPRLTGKDTALVRVSNKQPIYLRAGESDVAAIRQTFIDRQYVVDFNKDSARRVRGRYEEILRSGGSPIIIDAGANIGAASIWFATHYPEAKIIAIEPEDGNYSVLRKNAMLHPNIDAVHAAIGAKAGFVKVNVPDLGWSAQTERAESGLRIITIQEAFAGGVPFMAKIDIEGFESDLFSSSTEWLSDTFAVFIEPHDWLLPGRHTSKSFQAAMGSHDYEIYISGEILTYIRRE